MRGKSDILTVAAVLLGHVGAVQAQEQATTRIDVEDNLLVISIGPVDLPCQRRGRVIKACRWAIACKWVETARPPRAAATTAG